MARTDSGCEVRQQDFSALDLPSERFDGIFANASLFHVPSQGLLPVLRQLHIALKPAGVLFSSNPHGENGEGWNGERYSAYHDFAAWLIDVVNGDWDTDGCSSPAAIAGYPHITVPAGLHRGLPIGLSFFGAAFSEPTLLRLASGFEHVASPRPLPKFLPSV
jgi:SAM-dependent methyltransferase